ncbi:hypothetical protein SFRURICE_005757 [Spodoptera frugiperda]|nr:hypothetical protein SFRURICE_005757 [Spodoptera frugiperda]
MFIKKVPVVYKSHVIGGKPIAIYWAQCQTPCVKIPVLLCPNRESNNRPLAQQSNLQLLDQRVSSKVS